MVERFVRALAAVLACVSLATLSQASIEHRSTNEQRHAKLLHSSDDAQQTMSRDVPVCPTAPDRFFSYPWHCIGTDAPTCSDELATGGGCTVSDCVVRAADACKKDVRCVTFNFRALCAPCLAA